MVSPYERIVRNGVDRLGKGYEYEIGHSGQVTIRWDEEECIVSNDGKVYTALCSHGFRVTAQQFEGIIEFLIIHAKAEKCVA